MSLVDALLRTFAADISSLTVFPDFDGVFDVRIDDALVWSKDETGEFPENDHIVAALKQRL
ncbi:MAG: SelT/SelW/SelH family protein [Chloroflexota bacterium]|nr:MAG: SelT/SelW/SelH family protein [Chloroflexota bacterium]